MWNLKTRFLPHHSIIFMDSSFRMTSITSSTQSMAWFREMRDSKTYLFLKKFVEQWLFWWYGLKQMLLVVGNDEWIMTCSSTTLGMSSNQICHGWALMKTEWKRLYSHEIKLAMNSKMMVYDVANKASSSSLRNLSNSSKIKKWEILRADEFWSGLVYCG